MNERQADVDVVALVEEFLSGAVVAKEPKTVSAEAPATGAELATVRYLRRLQAGRGPLELSPGAYVEATRAGWLSPDGADVLRRERDRALAEMDRWRVWGMELEREEQELQELRAWRRRVLSQQGRALEKLRRVERCVGMCSPARLPLTAGIEILEGMRDG